MAGIHYVYTDLRGAFRRTFDAAAFIHQYRQPTAVNSAGFDELLYGNSGHLVTQAIAVIVVAAYAASVTWVLLKLINATFSLRVTSAEELDGLDVSLHGEVAYQS